MSASLWSTLQGPIVFIFIVCSLYYYIRSRFYPPFRPEQHTLKPRRDSTMRIAQMKDKASRQETFSEEELDVTVRSFQYAVGNFSEKILYSHDFDQMDDSDEEDSEEDIDWMCLRGILSQTAHKTHKEWSATERSADLLQDLLGGSTPNRSVLSSPLCRRLLHRVLEDGGWQRAESYAHSRVVKLNQLQRTYTTSTSCSSSHTRPSTLRHRQHPSSTCKDTFTEEVLAEGVLPSMTPSPAASYRFKRPWVVVICGLNGIRKTTSVYQPWFQELLHAALSSASNSTRAAAGLYTGPEQYCGALEDLPHGGNSFFRQLDYMIATVACEDFRELYEKAGLIKVGEYSKIKDAIFARYRTLAEMIGIILLKEARLKGMNVMLETSGKDVASFRYIDHLFPNSNAAGSWEHRDYNKLIVHFTLDQEDIRLAEQSVDKRMQQEMRDGAASLEGVTHLSQEVIRNIIAVNAGGPYGSEVLQSVQEASASVMNKIFDDHNNEEVDDEFDDWYMATIKIRPSETEKWSACTGASAGSSQIVSEKELKSFFFEEDFR